MRPYDIKMTQSKLDPELLSFVSSLSRVEEILAEHERGFWAQKIRRVRQIAEKTDGDCVEMFLGLFGGMGSFNDLVLNAPSQINDELTKERARA